MKAEVFAFILNEIKAICYQVLCNLEQGEDKDEENKEWCELVQSLIDFVKESF